MIRLTLNQIGVIRIISLRKANEREREFYESI